MPIKLPAGQASGRVHVGRDGNDVQELSRSLEAASCDAGAVAAKLAALKTRESEAIARFNEATQVAGLKRGTLDFEHARARHPRLVALQHELRDIAREQHLLRGEQELAQQDLAQARTRFHAEVETRHAAEGREAIERDGREPIERLLALLDRLDARGSELRAQGVPVTSAEPAGREALRSFLEAFGRADLWHESPSVMATRQTLARQSAASRKREERRQQALAEATSWRLNGMPEKDLRERLTRQGRTGRQRANEERGEKAMDDRQREQARVVAQRNSERAREAYEEATR